MNQQTITRRLSRDHTKFNYQHNKQNTEHIAKYQFKQFHNHIVMLFRVIERRAYVTKWFTNKKGVATLMYRAAFLIILDRVSKTKMEMRKRGLRQKHDAY